MKLRKLRLERGWSQETLAELSGLSVRTVQRIERGHKASLESLQALAATLDINLAEISMAAELYPTETLTPEEEDAMAYVRDIKGFYQHLAQYLVVNLVLVLLNLWYTPDNFWAIWPILGWGLGVAFHGIAVFEVFEIVGLFGADWEKRQIKRRLASQHERKRQQTESVREPRT